MKRRSASRTKLLGRLAQRLRDIEKIRVEETRGARDTARQAMEEAQDQANEAQRRLASATSEYAWAKRRAAAAEAKLRKAQPAMERAMERALAATCDHLKRVSPKVLVALTKVQERRAELDAKAALQRAIQTVRKAKTFSEALAAVGVSGSLPARELEWPGTTSRGRLRLVGEVLLRRDGAGSHLLTQLQKEFVRRVFQELK